MIMESQSSEKVEFYQHIEFKAVAVSDQSYNRKFCFEIKPRVASDREAQKLVLHAPTQESKKTWLKELQAFSTRAERTLAKQKKLVKMK